MISSPYKRAVDTIKPFADMFEHEIEIVDDFRERRIDSTWIEDFKAFSKPQWADFTYKLTDGEALGEVQKRNCAALFNIVSRYNNKNIVVGSHGTALATMINYFDKNFGYEEFERIKGLFPWIVKFTFAENALVTIEYINVFEI